MAGNDISKNAAAKNSSTSSPFSNPWVQLLIGVICMAAVANLQYGWTLFVNPIDAKYHWGRAAIQVAFSLFVLLETWLIPVEGYMVDQFGPRWVVMAGGILVACAWVLNSVAGSLPLLYFAAALGGIGTGCVYGTCVGNALKWFPGRRGLAAGVTASGFGAGAALTVGPIRTMIESSGYEQAFLVFGLIQGGIVFVMSWLLLAPPPQIAGAAVKPSQTAHGYTPIDVLQSPVFYVMYLMFVLLAAGALFTLSRSGSNPVIFVLVTALYFGVYGEIFSLFPATQGDTFGSKYAAANNGMLYTAKDAGSLLVPIAAIIAKSHGWGTVFTVAMTFNVVGGLLALFVLKPMRARHFAKSRATFET